MLEFKQDAVRLVESVKSIAGAPRTLGMVDQALLTGSRLIDRVSSEALAARPRSLLFVQISDSLLVRFVG